MKYLLSICFAIATAASPVAQNILPALKVEKGKRYITGNDQKPFFWLGDTAWELFHRLTFEETRYYLRTRAKQGYNVIQAVALAEFDGLNQPNRNGDRPLINNDPAQPNEAYFQHVDKVIDDAASLGMYIGLLPTWGDKFSKKWGIGPEIFTPANARVYGEFLGKRYQGKNIIWILGGDRNPESDEHTAIINSMAAGITSVAGSSQLITYHPGGENYSSRFFHDADWLSLNSFQSGHARKNGRNYKMLRHDYQLTPVKPTFDSEPRYENHTINWKPEDGYFNDFDVRQAAYWSVLSGACGHTYGCHDVWQMFDISHNPPVTWARTHWKAALHLPGAVQMGYLRKLMESVSWWKLEPAQQLITNENPEDGGYQVAAMSSDKDFLLAYTPFGRTLQLDLTQLNTNKLQAWWFNPRDGTAFKINEPDNSSITGFKPYVQHPETDWILIVMDKNKNWTAPQISY